MICGKGGLDFCLEGTDGFMCVWEGEDWKRNRLRGGNISFYLFIYLFFMSGLLGWVKYQRQRLELNIGARQDIDYNNSCEIR